MDVEGLPNAMRGLQRLTTPLHLISPCVWRCVRPAGVAWQPGHACLHWLGPRTRCRATAVEQQTAVSQPQTSNSTNGAVQASVLSADAPTFQEAIARLQRYWSHYGCAICQPHNTEVIYCLQWHMIDANADARIDCEWIGLPPHPEALQVGAGTMNPATYLRVNGPEPWNVCYVEPSIRPDDSRYGLNPNRLQRHTQVCCASRTVSSRLAALLASMYRLSEAALGNYGRTASARPKQSLVAADGDQSISGCQ